MANFLQIVPVNSNNYCFFLANNKNNFIYLMSIQFSICIFTLKASFSNSVFPYFPVRLLKDLQSAGIICGAILINMNPQDNHYPPFLHPEQSNYPTYHFKSDQNDKTTHLCTQQDYQIRQNDEYGWRSPFRPSSFFFTPTSPKHFQFDIANSDTAKSAFKVPLTVVSINKKIDFKALDEEQASENQVNQEELQDFAEKKHAPVRGIKNVKGLRSLSQSVYKIVSQLRKTKYKVVAERLIQDITKNGEPLTSKDQHNVKRRVYDALNVLIAAGMLQKQGKNVVCNLPYQGGSKRPMKLDNSWQESEKQKMSAQIRKRCESILEKQSLLQKLKTKKQHIARILHRNIAEPAEEESLLRFPVISIIIEEYNTQLVRNYQNQVIFKFPSLPLLYGDVDLLLQLKQAQQAPPPEPMQPQNIYNVIIKQEELQSQLKKEVKLEEQANFERYSHEYVKKEEV